VDIYPPTKQRPRLLELAKVLKSRSIALHRDECGDWAIHGKFGRVFAVPIGVKGRAFEDEGFQLVVDGLTTQWNNRADRAFIAFGATGVDGQRILDRLPSADEAVEIRHYLGIPKKPEINEAERQRRQEMLLAFRFKKRTR